MTSPPCISQTQPHTQVQFLWATNEGFLNIEHNEQKESFKPREENKEQK